MCTHTVGNLLPARARSPLALVAKAVLVDINNAIATLLSQRSHIRGPEPKLLQRARTVAIQNHIGFQRQLLENLATLGRLQVKVGCMLAHVSIDLEEWNIAQVRARNLQHIRAVLAQNPTDNGTCNNTAELKDLDSGKRAVLVRARRQRPGSCRRL